MELSVDTLILMLFLTNIELILFNMHDLWLYLKGWFEFLGAAFFLFIFTAIKCYKKLKEFETEMLYEKS